MRAVKTWADYAIDIPAGAQGEVDTTCPECSPQRKKKKVKCLSVNADKQTWICHHCGWSGGLVDGASKTDKLHWNKPKYRKPQELPKSDLSKNVLDYFAKRGIEEPILIRNQISEGVAYMPQAEDHVNCIKFPYFRNGELINVKYRDGKKNFRMEAGAERILYGLDDVLESQWIWVEGEIDKLTVEAAGYKSCVSVPDGAPSEKTKDYSSKFDFLESASDAIALAKRHVLAVDNDEPGKRLESELARRLGPEKCLRVNWPDGCKDANETLVKHGKLVLRDCIENAKPYPINGVFEVRDFADKIDDLYVYGLKPGLSTGWKSMDEYYTVRPGEWTLVTGIPNHGKSNWLDHLLVNLSSEHGLTIGVFSPENQPIERHASRLISKFAGMPFDRGLTPRIEPEDLKASQFWLDQHFAWILPDDDDSWSIARVLELAKVLVFRKGIQGLVIDPWNELDHSRPGNMTETEYISKALTGIRKFARNYGVHVWLVAHPTKMQKNTDGIYPIPTPYDVSGSAHWRNKADNCIAVYRHLHKPGSPVEVHIQKIRFDEIGQLGQVNFNFDKPTGRYLEAGQTVKPKRRANA